MLPKNDDESSPHDLAQAGKTAASAQTVGYEVWMVHRGF